MKVAVIGGLNSYPPYELEERLDSLCKSVDVELLITGDSSGVQHQARSYASLNNIPLLVMDTDWNRYGFRAVAIRNRDIVSRCDMLLLFRNHISPRYTVTEGACMAVGKRVVSVFYP